MNRLLRCYGFRKLAFGVASWPLGLLAFWVLSGPIADLTLASDDAKAMTRSSGRGLCLLGCAVWLRMLLAPLRPFAASFPNVQNVATAAVGMFCTAPGLVMLLIGGFRWLRADAFSNREYWLLAVTMLVPIAIGTFMAAWPDITEIIQANRTFRRLFVSGQGHAAGWLGPIGTRRLMRPLPQNPPENAGHRSPHLHLGHSLFESTFAHGQDVWLKKSHFVSCARPGSGKFVTSIAAQLCLHQGSGVFTSIKPELADFGVGRRVDQSLFESSDRGSFRSLGVDTRGRSHVRFMLPRGRGQFVLDPTDQSAWKSSHHDFLSEIDVQSGNAPTLINAIATASFPDDQKQRDRFFTLAPRGLFAASIGHVLTAGKDPRLRSLAFCSDYCMGIDPVERRADPQVFQANLISMMKNPSLGGFIQRSAASIAQLGPNAFGSVMAEFENNARWLSDIRVRQHLNVPSEFSYTELGDDSAPTSIFLVPPRGGADLQALIPWLRTHIELSLAIFETKRQRPQTDILFLCDEFRQYGQSINAIRLGTTTLREASVRLALYLQSWPSLIDTLGEPGANELEACSAMEFFGTDQFTAEKISRMLGKYTLREGGGFRQRSPGERLCDVVTAAEVMNELRKGSTLKYVFPATTAPMRLHRVAYKPMVTEEGTRYAGLPLEGHYDEHLSQFRYADRSA